MIDTQALAAAYRAARDDLLAERAPEGHWVGELCSSALSTATAVSALAVHARHAELALPETPRLVAGGLRYLAGQQNPDGGWGDTDRSLSNIATTMLVRAAFHLAGAADGHAAMLGRAEAYLETRGGVAGLRRRYGKDKTFAVPILTNCALAGLVPWSDVAPLPFEMACLPHAVLGLMRLPVVSYAIPALVAIGQARYFHRPPRNPVAWLVRRASVACSLRVLQDKQPASGGFLEATPLTSFVVMSLASIGRAGHPVVRRGLRFLLDSARGDGSWPIDTNLATWVTTLSINALAGAGEKAAAHAPVEWLLACQHTGVHPFTRAAPGGWGWTDLSGAVPDADDTPGALLALAAIAHGAGEEGDRQRLCGAPSKPLRGKRGQSPWPSPIERAARCGLVWLLSLQNRDGGWPTFCRGWGALPFDRSGSDLTAHALRALAAWRGRAAGWPQSIRRTRFDAAIARGLEYLRRQQRPDGSWLPLWFGNQHDPGEENPVYGTARVLLAYRDLGRLDDEAPRRGLRWLGACQNADGGWGGGPEVSSVEETGLAVEALLTAEGGAAPQPAAAKGLNWLIEAVRSGEHRRASPIGFYFARLWYYERSYPLIFTVAALGAAVARWSPARETT